MYILLIGISILALNLPYTSPNYATSNNRSPYWGAFRVRFGPDLKQNFLKFPKTVNEAKANGFVFYGSGCPCSRHDFYLGQRYIRKDDYGIALLFDKTGYLAGVQSKIPVDPRKNYPPENLIHHPFIRENNFWVVNVYFINPDRICKGRTRQEFISGGIGDGLYYQNGSNPLVDISYIPKYLKDFRNSNFYNISCYPMMGTHYGSFQIKDELDCDTLFPILASYDHGILIGVDFVYLPYYDSPIFEFIVPAKVYAGFIGPKAKCLLDMGNKNITTLHVYLIDDPQDVVCTPESTHF